MNTPTVAPFLDGRAMRQAVKTAAASSSGEMSITERMQQIWFDRFLCRVFSDEAASSWMLKGGVGLLARVREARSTQDIDMTVTGRDLVEAVADLQRMAARDLGDHMTFETPRRPRAIRGQGEDVSGLRVDFVGYCGGHEVARFHVDVVVAPLPVGKAAVMAPANRAAFRRPVASAEYRVFPIEDHLAEKAVSMLAHEHGDENTRVKDLVDIAIIARTHSLDHRVLRQTIEVTFRRAGAAIPRAVTAPPVWEKRFAEVAVGTLIEGVTYAEALADAIAALTATLEAIGEPADTSTAPTLGYGRGSTWDSVTQWPQVGQHDDPGVNPQGRTLGF